MQDDFLIDDNNNVIERMKKEFKWGNHNFYRDNIFVNIMKLLRETNVDDPKNSDPGKGKFKLKYDIYKQTFRISSKKVTDTFQFKQQVCSYFKINNYRDYVFYDQNGEEIDSSLDKMHLIVEYIFAKQFNQEMDKFSVTENVKGKGAILYLGYKSQQTPGDNFFQHFFDQHYKDYVKEEEEKKLELERLAAAAAA